MVQIIDHITTEDRHYICVYTAGPRVEVLGKDKVEVRITDDVISTVNYQLTVATWIQLLCDCDDEGNTGEDASLENYGDHLFRNSNEFW